MKRILICTLLMAVMIGVSIAEPIRQDNMRTPETITREDPVNMDQWAGIQDNKSNVGYVMYVKSIVRGSDAVDLIKRNLSYFAYDDPEPGQEYCIAVVYVRVLSVDNSTQRVKISYKDFEAVSSKGVVRKMRVVSTLMDDLELITPGEGETYLTFAIDNDDSPLLLYKQSIWFDLDF
ncbi:MAG: hypothetical protein VB087_12620 [Candidatus Limiplasma sp.]|nr:hypothetical protein [Candidatus Limiplasma sp.]